jgi:hypothetical protein
MNTIPLFRVVREDVGIADSFTAARSTRIDEPMHVTGQGVTLVGVKQAPHGTIQHAVVDGRSVYFAVEPKLRALLEAPIRAEYEQRNADALASMQAGPWYARAWRAIRRGK